MYVRVDDTGPGIADDERAAILEPLVQQVGRRHDVCMGGAGLGLTISRRLARRTGGELSVGSTIGVDSAFVLWLPVPPLESRRTDGGA